MKKSKKIGYIVSRFPSVWETFILREFSAVDRNGFDIGIFSLKNPKWKVEHDEVKPLLKKAYYSPFFLSRELIYSQFFYLIRKPKTYFILIFFIIQNSINDLPNLIKSLAIFPKSVYFAKVIKDKNINHVHAHWATIPTLAAFIISKLNDIPFSVTAHAIDIFQNTTMLEEKLSKAKFIVTCTKNNKEHLMINFTRIDQKKIFVNYHGIDLNKFHREYFSKNDEINILSVGRIEDSKGYPTLLRALKILKDDKIKFKCTIIGDGPRRKEIEKLISDLELKKYIVVTGIIPQEKVIDYYNRADIFVLSAVSKYHWGIPNVIIEAMAMEIPVITTPLPAMPEIIKDNDNGLIVPENDEKKLSEAIRDVTKSENKKIDIGKAGRETIEFKFDQRKTIRDLINIFDNFV